MREVAWGVSQDQLEDTNNHTPPHDVPAREWSLLQQSVLQSGLKFHQAEPDNHTQFNNVPTAMHTSHLDVRLAPVGLFKGKMIYGASGDRVPSPVNVHNSKEET
ncbi:unnamed protein product [Pleuronectes platessa]|uniref:Uncharacterized protein n=1 Tax=Pleuronectes platessa TaxID=8262 RepID=A0A9N7V4V9_PLEPL|nr:unnamed protein product [Pleuronectes platessa]